MNGDVARKKRSDCGSSRKRWRERDRGELRRRNGDLQRSKREEGKKMFL